MCLTIAISTILSSCKSDPINTRPGVLKPGISDIKVFLNTCPESDPYLDEILSDFEIRLNGNPITNIQCFAPTSSMNIEAYETSLIVLQALRVIRHMNTGPLPWTELSLYDWMKNSIGGVNIVDGISSGGYCCNEFNDDFFVGIKNLNSSNRAFKKKWIGISGTIDLLIHEVRHLEGPSHISCCGIPRGCDQEYDLNNISSYGTQLWLNRKWKNDEIVMGLHSYTPEEQKEIKDWFSNTVLSFEQRFCN